MTRSIRRRIEGAALGAAVASALACAGCADDIPPPLPAAHPDATEPRRGGTLVTATFGDIRGIDPANVSDGLAPMILESLFAGLVDFDHDGKVVPDLAERWTVEDGGRAYRFVLREGVRFHDGDEVTAEDVRRSVERALHPSAPNPFSSYFSSLRGYEALVAKKTEHLEGVRVDGKYVVTFLLDQPDAVFLRLLAMPMLRPTCKSAGARYTDTWHACGAGPFKLPPDGWDRGREVHLVRHDGYFKPGLPHLDGVRFLFHVQQKAQLFKLGRGEIDIYRDLLAPDLLALQSNPRWRPYGEYEPEKQIGGEAMNVEIAPFDNVEIRRAVAAAIDRDEIALVKAGNLRPGPQPIPPSLGGHVTNPDFVQKYDYAAALEHMRRAGYPYDPKTGKGGYPKTIPYIVYNQGLAEYTGQVLAQQLAKIGIRIELRVVNYPTFLAIRGRRGKAAFGPGFWQQDFPDALSFFEPLFHSRSINDEDSNNWSFYSNPRVDELLDRARRTLDDDARNALYVETSKILCDDAPWAFVYYYRWYSVHQPYVRDWRPHPLFVHELSRTWLDRAAGAVAARSVLSRDALAALFGDRPTARADARSGR